MSKGYNDSEKLGSNFYWLDRAAEPVESNSCSKIQVECLDATEMDSEVRKAIAGKKAALFVQVDRRLYALRDLQIAAGVALVLQ